MCFTHYTLDYLQYPLMENEDKMEIEGEEQKTAKSRVLLKTRNENIQFLCEEAKLNERLQALHARLLLLEQKMAELESVMCIRPINMSNVKR